MDLQELVDKLVPLVAQRLINQPALFGDSERVTIGENVGVVNTLFNTSSGTITVEDAVAFGHNVCLLAGTHDIRKKGLERMYDFPKEGHDIVIRGGAWLASNVTVIGPCEIGENSVVAAGSVVTCDVPPNCVYAGIPARFVKEIDFS